MIRIMKIFLFLLLILSLSVTKSWAIDGGLDRPVVLSDPIITVQYIDRNNASFVVYYWPSSDRDPARFYLLNETNRSLVAHNAGGGLPTTGSIYRLKRLSYSGLNPEHTYSIRFFSSHSRTFTSYADAAAGTTLLTFSTKDFYKRDYTNEFVRLIDAIKEVASSNIVNQPPIVNTKINGGKEFTTNRNVVLSVDASSNNYSVFDMQMRYSFTGETNSWSEWETFKFTKNLLLPAGLGDKRVFVQVRDPGGNIGNSYSTIKLVNEEDLQQEISATRISNDEIKPRILNLRLRGGATLVKTNNVILDFGVEDNVTLPENITIHTSLDGRNWTNRGLYDGFVSLNISGSGFKTVYIKAIDEAGNYTVESINFFKL